MRWSESVTLEFVKLYLKHECLWNPVHSDYKLKYVRNRAYEDIISDFKSSTNLTVSLLEIKMKIRSLRSTYAQQVQKILQRSAPDSIYEPSLVWFNEMDQCLKHIIAPVSRQAFSNDTPEVNPQQIWMNPDLQNGSLEETSTDPIVSQTDDEYDSAKQEERESSKTKSQSKSKRIKKKKNKSRSSVDYSTDSNSEQNTQEDEFDVYGKYIATQLRQMSIQRALRVQLEIQNLVSEARISEMCND